MKVRISVFPLLRSALFVVGLGLFSGLAHADDAGKKDEGKGGQNDDGKGGKGEQETRIILTKEEYDRLMSNQKKEEPTGGSGGKGKDDDDLRAKASKEKDDQAKAAAQSREVERALSFNMSIDDFVVKNTQLLPAEVVQIVKLAHKETYDSAVAKASALKAAMVQSYFSVQANVDALTGAQKAALDDYLKLTKTGKESRAADVYENIFEPALEMIRRVKKAEEVGRSRAGHSSSSESDQAYKDKLVRMSRKAHLGEKES